MPRRTRALLVALIAVAAAYGAIPRPSLRATSYSREVYDRRHRLLQLRLSSDDKYRRWVPLKRMSPALVNAMLLQEDRHFYGHPGVNPGSLARACWRTYVLRGRRIGGSTITMQLARLRFRLDSRTFVGKAMQIMRALQIERHYAKDDILEAYLNAIPFGGNVEGAGTASLIYFSKDADRLSLPEALALCVIPKSPFRRGPSAGGPAGGASKAVLDARRRLFARWAAEHPEDLHQRAMVELPIEMRLPGRLPFLAPHFVDAVLRDDPSGSSVITTLDLPKQRLLERKVRAYVERKNRIGIRNAAALLLDYPSMEVVASLGSVDFLDQDIQGQVNGVRARRSPGSALKPFIYGLAMDEGLVHPWSMLKDAPMSFGGFNPENFDRDFVGPIHAGQALIRSRNVPAVQLSRKLSSPGFYGFLRKAGIELLKEESHYGLALALGSAEVTMEDLARMYAMLANGGRVRPLRTRIGAPQPEGTRLLSEEASFLVLDILKDNPRPAQAFSSDWTRDALPVHWKTGTSYAFRDAWSVGVFGPYVLAVWVGNFDGQTNPAFIGAEAAAPLMFELIDALAAQQPDMAAPARPVRYNLAQVKVCSVSGQIPGPHCPHQAKTWFIPGKSPIQTCDLHREVLVDSRTGLRACSPGRGVRSQVFEFWSSDLLKIFRLAGMPRRLPPPDNPECGITARSTRGLAPVITSPQPGLTYSLRAARLGSETIPLAAVTDADSRQLFWFVNDRFVGRSRNGEPFFWSPQPGAFIVRVVDDQGRADARDVDIAVVE
ncbi:MAG: penicillin-binding protein 1C [Elusimicrobia bacterium]|nr:penicillin-binding protein 1C [Elusimicrobiota bacterium]